MSPERVTAHRFGAAVEDGLVWPGDCVLYDRALPTPLAWAIARVQRRLLADLGSGKRAEALTTSQDTTVLRPASAILDAAGYTHAGIVYDADRTVEMTAPRARVIAWPQVLSPGDRVLVVRPLDGTRATLRRSADLALDLAVAAKRYPWRELLTYWFASWPRKLRLSHAGAKAAFAEVFRDKRADVCSGTVWTCWRQAGCVNPATSLDAWPEAWYPARLAADRRYLRPVALFEIVGEKEAAEASGGRGSSLPRTPTSVRTTAGARNGDGKAVGVLVPPLPACARLMNGTEPQGASPATCQAGRPARQNTIRSLDPGSDGRGDLGFADSTQSKRASQAPAGGILRFPFPVFPVPSQVKESLA